MRVAEIIVEAALGTSMASPPWFHQGRLLSPDDRDTLDVSEFIDGGEVDHEWRLCRVPVQMFSHAIAGSWEEAVAGFIKRAGAEYAAEEPERIDSIKNWFDQHGVEASLRKRPVVALLTSSGTLKILDGFHRLAVAVHLFRATHVIAAVGLGDSDE